MSAIGIELALSIVIGFFGGQWIDGKLGTGFVKWIGFVLGVAAGFKSLYRLARNQARIERDRDQNDEP